MSNKSIKINVPVLARVEGEGALDLHIEDNAIRELKLRIYEPPRYFEKFLEGRSYRDVPDTVARICGICPVAYQMSAVHAIESIFGITATPWVRDMRRLLYCGEWMQSHSLHIHMLAAPDFLGYNSIIEMAADHADVVRRGLLLQGLGNDLIRLLGGRSVHPVAACTGGFYHAPGPDDVATLLKQLQAAQQDTSDLIEWVAALEMPDDQQDFVSVSIRHPDEYAMNEGRIVSDAGMDIGIGEFDQHFKEVHMPQSTALHCLLHDQPYLVGPLARINNNMDKLPEATRELLDKTGVKFPSRNMFHSMLARAIELHFALNEAIRIMQAYERPDEARLPVEPRAGVGFGCTEAPRGILWHRYEMDEGGHVASARIVPPTSQNQSRIEQDIENALNRFGLDHEDSELQLHAEKVIRNYDPCISCATHFLKLNVEREGHSEPVHQDVILSGNEPVTLIAIGSPLPPDDIAWQLADRMQRDVSCNELMQAIKLDRPGADLLKYLQKHRQIILLDAVQSSSDHLVIISPEQLVSKPAEISSHGLGLAEALKLAMSLGQSMEHVSLIGIPVSDDAPVPIESYADELKDILEPILEHR